MFPHGSARIRPFSVNAAAPVLWRRNHEHDRRFHREALEGRKISLRYARQVRVALFRGRLATGLALHSGSVHWSSPSTGGLYTR